MRVGILAPGLLCEEQASVSRENTPFIARNKRTKKHVHSGGSQNGIWLTYNSVLRSGYPNIYSTAVTNKEQISFAKQDMN